MSINVTDDKKKSWAELVAEDRAVHAAENAAWYAYIQQQDAELKNEEAEKAERKAKRRAARIAAMKEEGN